MLLGLALLMTACESTPSATPPLRSPSATTALATATPHAAPGGETFGIALSGSGMENLRTEVDADPVVRLIGIEPPSVSPDGRRLAWWQVAIDGAPELWLFDTTRGDEPRRVYSVPEPYVSVSGAEWSSDSRSHLFVARDLDPVDRERGTAWSALRSVDVVSGAARDLLRVTGETLSIQGRRGPHAFLLAITPPTGLERTRFEVVRDDGAIVDALNDGAVFNDRVDDLGRMSFRIDCAAEAPRCFLRVRDLRDGGVVTPHPAAAQTIQFALFRPTSSDIVVLLGEAGARHLELWPEGGRGERRVLGAIKTKFERSYFRPDGSAIVLFAFDGSAGGRWYGELAELTAATVRPIEIAHDGNPDGWIRLGITPEVRTYPAPAGPTNIGDERARWLATRVARTRAKEIRVALTTRRAATAWLAPLRPAGQASVSDEPVYLVAVGARASLRSGPAGPSGCDWYMYVVDAGTGGGSSESGVQACMAGVFLGGAPPWPPR